ncbi:MAG: tRNA (adenosine(37)-N6)-dimethylallyltransferase MiaA [Phototrophicaceae bacterium]|jgi:tRNA dimethylallyltransferase
MPSLGKPLVVILGATAVGKTPLAISLAEALNGEVVSADSRQIYAQMNIGTAKPSAAEQARIRHHLLDVVQPDQTLPMAAYLQMAYAAINQLHNDGKLPFLVGGTGQYITALLEGWSVPEVPPDEDYRTELEQFAKQAGTEALYARLTTADPDAAEKIHPNNVRRVIRALEVLKQTGIRFSELQRKTPPPYRVYTIGLDLDREALYARADQRIDHMITAGFVDEVQGLLNQGYTTKLPSMSGIGYLQLAAYLAGKSSLKQAVSDTKHLTHDFIRRQITWFRGHDHAILWHNSAALHMPSLLEDLHRWLAG